ncbi:tetraspanin-10 [Pangasianodon hypophthalmus]|uniref:tetraspanin-10 n=1 Tax=Pangasianodon hypophthalmus TaxID=310915 RepID=UPI000EFEC73E|nr:tetraspanin-10 [Pangasianodon hypophthalmus]
MSSFWLSRRIPFFWKPRSEIQDDVTKPLISKVTTRNGIQYQGTDISTERQTDSSSLSHDEQTKLSSWTFPHLQTHNSSNLTDFLLKYVLFTSNLLFSVLGLATLGLGFWGLVNKESFAQEKLDGLGTDPMLLLVFLGLLLSMLCLTGCVGALRENNCLLRTFSATLLVLVAAQVLVAIVAYSLQGWITELLRSAMLTAMTRYQDDLDLRFLTDEIQIGLQCCGVDNYRDWEVNQYFNCSSPGVQACGVPPSCCVDPLENGTVWNSQCGFGAQQLDEFSAQSVIFLGGCVGSISRWLNLHSELIGIVTAALLAVQILTLITATRLLDRIQWNKTQAW